MDCSDDLRLTCVRYEKRGHLAVVTLARPHVLNAMNDQMHRELKAVWEDLEEDPNVWVGLVKGEGARAFSVGQDLKELAAKNPAPGVPLSTMGSSGKPGAPRLTDRFDITKPLVAQVSGFALGGGFELAMACDIIIASTDAEFGLPEVRLGLVAGAGGLFRLPRQVPLRIALGYAMTGRRMSAAEAFSWGLVNETVAPEDLPEATSRWVDDLIAAAPLAVRAAKEAVHRAQDVPLPEAFTQHYALEELRRVSQDAIEGPRAFVERRSPMWRGALEGGASDAL
jgi:dehydration protein DpgD